MADYSTESLQALLRTAAGQPPQSAVTGSRRAVARWFAQEAPLVQWAVIESPIGPLYIAAGERGLQRICFGSRTDAARFAHQLDPLARTERGGALLDAARQQLAEYFAGQRRAFDVLLDTRAMTPFQRQVLAAAASIPAGTVRTYGELARALGNPNASRAVGRALGANPIPIIIPCHRVVGSDGSLTGYAGGVEIKQHLLQLEGAW